MLSAFGSFGMSTRIMWTGNPPRASGGDAWWGWMFTVMFLGKMLPIGLRVKDNKPTR